MFCKIVSAAALAGCVAGAVAAPHTPVISPNFGMAQYNVVKRDGALSLDGKVDEAVGGCAGDFRRVSFSVDDAGSAAHRL